MSAPTQRLLVSGGRGRLASLIADHFRAPSHTVSLFSRNAGQGFHPQADLLEPAVLAQADALLHLSWSTLPATAETQPEAAARHDLPFLDQLLAALVRLPTAQRPLLVFFSSGGAVYGDAPGRPSREDDPCHPIGAYGRGKLAAEQLIAARQRVDGLPVVILRISNPYGYPVPGSRAQGLIPHLLRCADSQQPFTIWGDGSARKDFIYYTDFLSALEQVLARRLTGTFNLCAGASLRVDEVIRLVETELAQTLTLLRQPAAAWDVHDSLLDNSRLAAATGWAPQVSLAEGIRRAAAGYVSR